MAKSVLEHLFSQKQSSPSPQKSFFLNRGRYSSRCQNQLFQRKRSTVVFFSWTIRPSVLCLFQKFSDIFRNLFSEYIWRALPTYNTPPEDCFCHDKGSGPYFRLSICKMNLDIVLTFIFTLFLIIVCVFTATTYKIRNWPALLTHVHYLLTIAIFYSTMSLTLSQFLTMLCTRHNCL